MDSIQIQASKLWNLLFSDETAATYQKTLNLTGTILKETAQLVWLIICSAFVFGAWFADTSVQAGKGIRDWLDRKVDPDSVPTDPEAIADKGKSLLDTGRVGMANLLNQAREQLGIEPQEMPAIDRAAKAIKPDKPTEPAKLPTSAASTSSSTTTSTASTPSSTLPTNKPFDKSADTTVEPTPAPSTQTVGSSVGAGSPSSDDSDVEITREDVYDESTQYDD